MGRRLAWVVGIVAAAWAVARWAGPFRVEVAGDSMRPTLAPGDWLVAVRPRRIRLGDLVVIRRPELGIEVVKRVAGLPGEGALGSGEYLVLGDDPARSTDGRSFGPVAGDRIAGVVVARYWPRPARL
ncbi:MAG: S26 family signal peptidase [Actinomycetota bacterium]